MLDPSEIEFGWFRLELSTLEVLPRADLTEEQRAGVEATIQRLKLKDEECVQARAEHYDEYLRGDLSRARLRRWSPFVAAEVARQGLMIHEVDGEELNERD